MRKIGRLIVLFATAAALLLLSGCHSNSADEMKRPLVEAVTVTDMTVETGADGTIELTAQVTLPDYGIYMPECWEKATAESEGGDFEKTFYSLLREAAEQSPKTCTRELTVDLTAIAPNREADGWTDNQLAAAAREAAFETAEEEFALSVVRESFPSDFLNKEGIGE